MLISCAGPLSFSGLEDITGMAGLQGGAGLEGDGCQGPLFWLTGWTILRASPLTRSATPTEGHEKDYKGSQGAEPLDSPRQDPVDGSFSLGLRAL